MSLLTLLALSPFVLGQSLTPLVSRTFTWPDIPFQVTGNNGGERGPQSGFNLCNSTTQNQQSDCQTLFLNNLADFCMWSSNLISTPQNASDTIGESEAREVAWCTGPGHGTRVIPPGAITGAQWLYAKDYLQVVGFIDQTQVGLAASDAGGELDPHGADQQGNPLGGIVFTNGFGLHAADFNSIVTSGGGNFTANQTFTQVIEWVDFIGNGVFCLKMCNPSDPDAPDLCNHIYDEVGCTYNALANYNSINGSFTVCDSDDMVDPGFYTLPSGQTTQWVQPFTGPVVPPYTPTVPPSSNCFTYSSQQLYAAAATDTAAFPSLTLSSSASGATNGSNSGSGSRSGSGAQPSQTGSGSGGAASGAVKGVGMGATFVGAAVLTTLITMASMLA